MRYGTFDDAAREYVITRPDTPQSWSSYLGSTDYGAIITNNPGGKENAGIFNHTQGWGLIADCLLGEGDRAYETHRASMPAAYNDRAEIRHMEPYVQGQTTDSTDPPRPGNARTAWLTGAAAWSYCSATHHVLGLWPEVDGLRPDPCIPSAWPGSRVKCLFRRCAIDIELQNPHGVCRGVRSLELNGRLLAGNLIPAAELGERNRVVAVLRGQRCGWNEARQA